MSNFHEILTDRDRARLDAATDAVASRAKAAGVNLDKEALSTLPSIRLATLTDNALDVDAALREAKASPSFAEAFRAGDVQTALDSRDPDTMAAIYSLPPSERMNAGRRLDAQRPAETKKVMTAEDEAQAILMLRKISHAPTRLAMARELGLA